VLDRAATISQGLRNVGKRMAIVRDEGDARLPDLARQVLQVLAAQIEQLEAAVAAIEKQLMAWHKSNPVSQRLASVPGIGPIIATANRCHGGRTERLPQWARVRGLAGSGATAEFHRRQTPPGRDIQAR
jgi:transposase